MMANTNSAPETTTITTTRPSMALSEFDPFREAMGPPPNETLSQREAREREELEAKKRSEGIDAIIYKEKQELANRKAKGRVVRVLLLGELDIEHSTGQWFD